MAYEYEYENFTAREIVTAANYAEARREVNDYVDPAADLVASRHCHCGQPLDDGACECGNCTAEELLYRARCAKSRYAEYG